ncbi:MAG: carboxypeptidase-like regulatory domain-containing protein [Dehalococcoidia bacterium]|nr:carboxypeptidase-like regulatory domain-containing protein [Dehalococcoidia bacterium]
MMRTVLLILTAILVLGLLTIGSTLAPCQAIASNFPANKVIPIITNATLPNEETTPSKAAFQLSYLSLSLTTDKSVYLTGETISITVSTNVINTHVRLLAQLPGGSQETIANITTNATHKLSWPAPSTSGQIRFTCEGEAIVEVWSTCTSYVCVDEDCQWETYPCLRSTTVMGNAFADIRVFSRATSISGRVIDANQRPIPGATVYVASTMQSTTTNNDGFYEFISYQLGNNYTLVNQIPTATGTVSVEAIACEPQAGKTVQVQAERGASDVNFTLNRSFYPPAIDLSEFTFDAFPGWPEAKEYSTWQNILGITIDGPVEPKKLLYGTKEISPPLFNIGTKKLYLITKPEFGRYFLELQSAQNTEYAVAAAATLNNLYLEPVTASGSIEGQNSQRLRLMLKSDGMELEVIKPPSLLLIIIPIVVGLLGGLVAAYFLTGGKFRGLGKAPAARKSSKAKETTKGEAHGKPTVKKTKKK